MIACSLPASARLRNMPPQNPLEEALLQRSVGTSGTTPANNQDPAITRALALLTDDERPTYSIEVIDPDPVKYPIFKNRPKTEAMVDSYLQKLFVNRQGPSFADDRLLASKLAHEGEHIRHVGQPDRWLEGPAYQREYDVLARLKYNNKDYMKALQAMIKARMEADKKEQGKGK